MVLVIVLSQTTANLAHGRAALAEHSLSVSNILSWHAGSFRGHGCATRRAHGAVYISLLQGSLIDARFQELVSLGSLREWTAQKFLPKSVQQHKTPPLLLM